ncbi:Guanylate cyclase soluble subunit alpha-1 [Merluccius polli]|uniref:Guanylate cyclase soluble subunit alpha-1 n=1 Tax=Merluccius polli TaxID=89951 RepID=A0AA47MEL5_MERPO|nr:Guanylate cyclase soluble subunit alpha-1 [Merluccius polli]
MFCAKLKELNISAECPFSSLARRAGSGDPGDPPPEDPEPVSQEDPPPVSQENPPPQRPSRLKVNLHSLGESIRKLAHPEFQRLHTALDRIVNPQILPRDNER